METNRELLELAAKAAGIKIDKSPYNGGGHGNTGFDILGNAVLDWHNSETWNPLIDDGDALRLAVKIGFINPGCWPNPSFEMELLIKAGSPDWYAATRRAIVRAAAAISKEAAK